ncbi:hypothetical protein C943_04276 [Mariniradius saccharolyticus AK6]|uniref:Uncharacterized protein n=1 Tax=Mariniradius saccharolyticus AK6 TaxID=1239962 RepID=M7XZN1_9BACT|nr:hypothetical protein C943_04276 [Mariniradius saccharolyticus AK6]
MLILPSCGFRPSFINKHFKGMGLFPVPFFNVRLEVGLGFVKLTLKKHSI